ncbi:MAG: hypothetical protein ACRCYR_19755 [Phycicoccus sp.]
MTPLRGVDWSHQAVRAVDIGDEGLASAITGFLEVVSTATHAHAAVLDALGATLHRSAASWRDVSERAADAYTEQTGRPVTGSRG